MNPNPLSAEKSPTLVTADFPDAERAEQAAEAARAVVEPNTPIAVVAPGDPHAARKFQPESAAIWHTILKSHALLFAAGLAVGLALGAAAIAWWPAAAASPWLTMIFAGAMGLFFGGMLAGLFSLRPDQSAVSRATKERLERDGRHAVAVRPRDEAQAEQVAEALRAQGSSPLRSL